MVQQIAQNLVNGVDEDGRTMKNHVDSSIMPPFQGKQFFDMVQLVKLEAVKMMPDIDHRSLYYKGNDAGLGLQDSGENSIKKPRL